ncbi:MAG: hypothetical protein AABY22_04445 [Nanoarchaeota archaeon]
MVTYKKSTKEIEKEKKEAMKSIKVKVKKYWTCLDTSHEHRTKSKSVECQEQYFVWSEKQTFGCSECDGGREGCTKNCSCIGCEGFGR